MIAEHAFRMTKQRRVMLEELRKSTSHPTADELYRVLRGRLPKISLGTVYRNLDVMSRTGLIQKLETGGDQLRFDGNAAAHYHIRCVACGRVDDAHGVRITVETPAEGVAAYEIVGHRFEFMGVCSNCRSGHVNRVRGGQDGTWETRDESKGEYDG